MDDVFWITDQAIPPLQVVELVAPRLGGDAQLPALALNLQRHPGVEGLIEELVDVPAKLR